MPNRTVIDTSASNAYVYTIPAGVIARLSWLYVTYTSNATVGNRQLRMSLLNASDVVVANIHAGIVQAASLVRAYSFVQCMVREIAFVDNSLQVPLPSDFVIPAGWKIRVNDSAGISATDSMAVALQYNDIAKGE